MLYAVYLYTNLAVILVTRPCFQDRQTNLMAGAVFLSVSAHPGSVSARVTAWCGVYPGVYRGVYTRVHPAEPVVVGVLSLLN